MPKNWKQEVARDCIALGSIPFYGIFMIRSLVGQFGVFMAQLAIAALIIFILYKITTASDLYLARGIVLATFSSLFYQDYLFTIFAFLLYGLMILSSYALHKKCSAIFKGIVIGALSTFISYLLSPLVVAALVA